MKLCLLKWLLIPWLCASALAQGLSPAPEQAAMNSIRPDAIRAHMRFLSDSLLQGRGTGTPGYQIAGRYVATRLEAAGLHPAGVNRTWYQTVTLRKSVVDDAKSSVALVTKSGEQTLLSLKDYVLYGDLNRADSKVDAPLVFVGFGVTAKERDYDDYAGTDVKGKIVVLLDGAPAKFPSTVRAYYSDIIVKARNAVAHGAVGFMDLLTPEDRKRYAWEWLVPQIQMGFMQWLEKDGSPHNTFAELRGGAFLSQSGADKLFAGSTKTLDQIFEAARASQPQSLALPVTARIHSISVHTSADSPNIIGEVRGSDPALRSQYVVYTAHVDHLGICPPVNGDNVCHGALDNASGTASLLEIARAFASLPKAPRRSILFVFVTGEEMGLLGSDYFANFPTVPRSAIVANINIDGAPGLFYPMKDLIVLGIEHSSLEQPVQSAAKQIGYSLSPDPMPEENFFVRSDQYSFVQQGVPAVDITDGVQSLDPKIDGFKLQKEWLVTKYHTPLDNMDQPLDYDSGARAAGVNFLVGFELPNRTKSRPGTKATSSERSLARVTLVMAQQRSDPCGEQTSAQRVFWRKKNAVNETSSKRICEWNSDIQRAGSSSFPSSCCNPSLIQKSLSERYRDDAHVLSSKVRDEVPRGPAKNSRMVVTLVSRMVSMLCDGHRKLAREPGVVFDEGGGVRPEIEP